VQLIAKLQQQTDSVTQLSNHPSIQPRPPNPAHPAGDPPLPRAAARPHARRRRGGGGHPRERHHPAAGLRPPLQGLVVSIHTGSRFTPFLSEGTTGVMLSASAAALAAAACCRCCVWRRLAMPGAVAPMPHSSPTNQNSQIPPQPPGGRPPGPTHAGHRRHLRDDVLM
jgi:hypothetical protein